MVPNQIEALINQDPVISQQISLWNRTGSQAIQGNLLIIPLEQSLLYVEPLYIEAERNSLPTLARVIVVYENQIVMAKTLKEAIDSIFSSPSKLYPYYYSLCRRISTHFTRRSDGRWNINIYAIFFPVQRLCLKMRIIDMASRVPILNKLL